MLYTIPTFHNPAGITQPAERRKGAARHRCERGDPGSRDDPYALLGFDGTVPRAMRADDRDHVVYPRFVLQDVGVGPAGRLGGGAARCQEKLVLAAEAAVLCPSNFTQGVVSGSWRPSRGANRWTSSGPLPRAAGRPARDAGRTDARRNQLDRPGRRLLFVAHVARRPGRHRHAAPGRERSGRLRTRDRVLQRRPRAAQHAVVVLLPRPRPDPRRVRRLATVMEAELEIGRTFGTASALHRPSGAEAPVRIWPEETDEPPPHPSWSCVAGCHRNATSRSVPAAGSPKHCGRRDWPSRWQTWTPD